VYNSILAYEARIHFKWKAPKFPKQCENLAGDYEDDDEDD
jgi:hypothetical protein